MLALSFPRLASAQASPPVRQDDYWSHFAFGFAASVGAHELGHILMAYAVGSHPSFGFNRGRPTIYSGIDSRLHPHKQFLFSAAGLTTQDFINEAILDIPRSGGGALERGILAGGIGTTLFYITLGRNGAVSDVAFMSRTSTLSRNQVSLIFGGISAIQSWKISRNSKYDHFFLRPTDKGAALGLSF